MITGPLDDTVHACAPFDTRGGVASFRAHLPPWSVFRVDGQIITQHSNFLDATIRIAASCEETNCLAISTWRGVGWVPAVMTNRRDSAEDVIVQVGYGSSAEGPYDLAIDVRFSITSPTNTACASAMRVEPGVSGALVQDQIVSGIAQRPPACPGGEAQHALFYRVPVSPGQRLLVSAGSRSGRPQLGLFTDCARPTCLSNLVTRESDIFIERSYRNTLPHPQDVIVTLGDADLGLVTMSFGLE